MLTSIFDRWKKSRGPDVPAASPDASREQPGPPARLTCPVVAERLQTVMDPEVGLNIVDLGLLYDLHVAPPAVVLTLTMTTPACPLSDYIVQQARSVLHSLPGIEHVEVDLVWQPAWSPLMMDPAERERRFGSSTSR